MSERQLTDHDFKTKDLAEIYKKIKLPKDITEEISKMGEKQFESFIRDNFKEDDDKEKRSKELLLEAYENIIEILKKYVDINPIYHPIVAIWIIGTYLHHQFRSYPFLFFNAMKGSGKTRILNLIAYLSNNGEIQQNMTEAVMFRTNGTLCIDEFEGITRRGNENLRELLNAAYKKGSKVKRMKQKKTDKGVEQVVEEFDVFRPICLANIWGLENVLGDRCISVVLEKSSNQKITRLVEIFDEDILTTRTKQLLIGNSVVWCSVVTVGEGYRKWNEYVTNNYTTTHTNNYIKLHSLFDRIKDSNLDGRNLEITMPLLIIANTLGEDVLNSLMSSIEHIMEDRKVDDIYNNKDVSLIDFVSQEMPKEEFISISELTRKFKEFIGESEDWINSRFVGRCLERTKLILKKKRLSTGIYVMLNYAKAQEKIKMFK